MRFETNAYGGELEEIKVAAILVITKELAKFGFGPAAGDLFAAELPMQSAVAADETFRFDTYYRCHEHCIERRDGRTLSA